jgi:hypothetical protein
MVAAHSTWVRSWYRRRACKLSTISLIGMVALCAVSVAADQPKAPSPSDSTTPSAIPVSGKLLAGCQTAVRFSTHDNWELSVAYNSGAWDKVQTLLDTFLASLPCAGTNAMAHGAASVLFFDLALAPPSLVRVLYDPARADGDPYNLRLTRPTIFDVHLFTDQLTFATSSYSIKPSPNPLVAAVAKVVPLLSQGLLKAPVSVSGARFVEPPVVKPPPPPHVSILVYKIKLPAIAARGTLTIADTGHLAGTFSDDLYHELDRLERDANHPVAVRVNGKLNYAFKANCVGKPETGVGKPETGVGKPEAISCPSALTTALEAATWPPAEADDIQRLYNMYLGLASLTTPVASATQYVVAPLTQVDIGLGTGVIFGTSLNRPVKVDSSKNLVDDQPTTLLTFASLNYHPGGYDETTILPRAGELFRLFGGIALTPNPGVVAGLGYGIPKLRGLAVTAGGGVLLANLLRRGDTVGIPPRTDGKPTRRGALGIWFIGIGYSL